MVKKAKGTTLTVIYQEKLKGIDVEIRRVHGRMFRWVNRLDKLMKSRTRFERLMAQAEDEAKPIDKPVDLPKPDPVKPDESLDIPREFRRELLQNEVKAANARIEANRIEAAKKRDEIAAEAIRQQQADRKKVKAKAASEKSRAKRRGELRKMPLTGKAALAAIRGTE